MNRLDLTHETMPKVNELLNRFDLTHDTMPNVSELFNRSDLTHATTPKVSELFNRSDFTHEVSAHLAFCVDPGQAPGAVHGGAVTARPPGRLPLGPAGELDLLQIRQPRPLAFHLQVGGPEPEDPGSVRV